MTVILIAAAIILCFGWYFWFGSKKQCRNCGSYMPTRAQICPVCGYRLREDYDNPHKH